MKEKRGFKAVTIFFVFALAVMSVLLVSMVLSGKQVDGTEKSPVITAEEYRGVRIASEARGKVTEAEVDSLIQDYGEEGLSVITASKGTDSRKIPYLVLGAGWGIALARTVVCGFLRKQRRGL
nr:hypothetical protein [Massilistercora timonensis]